MGEPKLLFSDNLTVFYGNRQVLRNITAPAAPTSVEQSLAFQLNSSRQVAWTNFEADKISTPSSRVDQQGRRSRSIDRFEDLASDQVTQLVHEGIILIGDGGEDMLHSDAASRIFTPSLAGSERMDSPAPEGDQTLKEVGGLRVFDPLETDIQGGWATMVISSTEEDEQEDVELLLGL
jgi:hypothetical protein